MYFWFTEGPKNYSNDTVKDAVKVLYEVSFLADASIYIFLNPSVRKELRRVTATICSCRTKAFLKSSSESAEEQPESSL